MENKDERFSLSIVIPVLNRVDLFKFCIESLMRNLDNVDTDIWIFDNGSDKETKDFIFNLQSSDPNVVLKKIFLEKNYGIPYVVNLFCSIIENECDLVRHKRPEYVLLMDGDAYFKKPLRDLLFLLQNNYIIGLLSAYDSIEHKPIGEVRFKLKNNDEIILKQKNTERMLSLFLRREELLYCYPYPHYRNRDVDWELTNWHPNSFMQRGRKIYAVKDYVLHLGIFKSSWKDFDSNLTTQAEMDEVSSILNMGNGNNGSVE